MPRALDDTATRESVERAYGRPLSDALMTYLSGRGYVDDPAGASTVGDVLAELRQLDAIYARRPEPRSRAPRDFAARLAVLDALHAAYAANTVHLLRDELNLKLMDAGVVVATMRRHQPVVPPALLPLPAGDVATWIENRQRDEMGDFYELSERDPGAALAGYLAAGRKVETLSYASGRRPVHISVSRDGALGRLAVGARELAETWVWDEHEAVRYVVTGGAPPHVVYARSRLAVRQVGRLDTMTRIHLELDPELAPSDVAAIYARVRKRARPTERVRPLSAAGLALARLALEHPGAGWNELLGHWRRGPGRGQPGRYVGPAGRSHFMRDVRTALRRLEHRGWRP